MNNTALTGGGAIHLRSHAQLRLHPLANLTFVANTGRLVRNYSVCNATICIHMAQPILTMIVELEPVGSGRGRD